MKHIAVTMIVGGDGHARQVKCLWRKNKSNAREKAEEQKIRELAYASSIWVPAPKFNQTFKGDWRFRVVLVREDEGISVNELCRGYKQQTKVLLRRKGSEELEVQREIRRKSCNRPKLRPKLVL